MFQIEYEPALSLKCLGLKLKSILPIAAFSHFEVGETYTNVESALDCSTIAIRDVWSDRHMNGFIFNGENRTCTTGYCSFFAGDFLMANSRLPSHAEGIHVYGQAACWPTSKPGLLNAPIHGSVHISSIREPFTIAMILAWLLRQEINDLVTKRLINMERTFELCRWGRWCMIKLLPRVCLELGRLG